MPRQPTKDVVSRAILSMGCKYASKVLRKKISSFFVVAFLGEVK